MLDGVKIGFAMCGSYCTFSKALPQMQNLVQHGACVIPIMSENASSTDTRFGTAKEIKSKIYDITGKDIIDTIKLAEPIGPKKLLDILVIAPATGNTIAKIANAITDTSVTMAAKATMRNGRPVVVCTATNDGLSASAKNIGTLMDMKGIFMVPLQQDDHIGKPTSIVADFSLILPTVISALKGEQYQPLL